MRRMLCAIALLLVMLPSVTRAQAIIAWPAAVTTITPITWSRSSFAFARMRADSSASSRDGARRGAAKGAIIGAALGFASRYMICDGASCRASNQQRFRHALVAAAVDGALGALIGWKLGSR